MRGVGTGPAPLLGIGPPLHPHARAHRCNSAKDRRPSPTDISSSPTSHPADTLEPVQPPQRARQSTVQMQCYSASKCNSVLRRPMIDRPIHPTEYPLLHPKARTAGVSLPTDISSLPVCHPPDTLESVQCTPRKWKTDDLLAQSHGRRPASRSCSSREAFQIRLSYEHTRNSSIFSYENMVFSYKQTRGPATKMRAPTARSSYGTLRDAASLSCIRRCPVKGRMRSHVYTLGVSC